MLSSEGRDSFPFLSCSKGEEILERAMLSSLLFRRGETSPFVQRQAWPASSRSNETRELLQKDMGTSTRRLPWGPAYVSDMTGGLFFCFFFISFLQVSIGFHMFSFVFFKFSICFLSFPLFFKGFLRIPYVFFCFSKVFYISIDFHCFS